MAKVMMRGRNSMTVEVMSDAVLIFGFLQPLRSSTLNITFAKHYASKRLNLLDIRQCLGISMQTRDTEPVTLHLPKPLASWLRGQADKQHRSLNNYLNLVLEDIKEKEKIPCISAQ
jgi:hypothetical protein